MRKYRTWHEVLVEQLADSDEALDYLQFSLQEYQKDGDTPFFLRALRTVIEAQGESELSKKAGIPSESLSKVLSSDEPPRIDTLSAVLNAFGWRLTIEPLENAELDIKTQSDESVGLNKTAGKIASKVAEAPPS